MPTRTAVFQPAVRVAGVGVPWTASTLTTVTPSAAPTYRLVLLMPLPIPARRGGPLAPASRPSATRATASPPSDAFTTPVPRPATSRPGSRDAGLEPGVTNASGTSPAATTT